CGTGSGRPSGRLRHQAGSNLDLPAVGDWVAITFGADSDQAVIHHVLPRKTRFIRKSAGRNSGDQVIAANVDTVFLMTSLNQDFNPRRLERYLVLAWDSGASPVILLSKSDLCSDITKMERAAESVSAGAPIHTTSVKDETGLAQLNKYLLKGQTVAVLGSSGVGKSSLINYLAGRDLQEVSAVREGDDRGRHTTTRRQLFVLPSGGLVIDTPGLREIQLTDAQDGMTAVFDDVQSIVARCRFTDCTHQSEPDCAVRDALSDDSLSIERFASYKKLTREIRYAAIRQDKRAQAEHKKKWKKLCYEGREIGRNKRR
ncbi:MAG TPA: ribosome small subunit-dependent GTPase A, partial [Blastocatellia bacterium]